MRAPATAILTLTAVLAAGCTDGDDDPDVALDQTSPLATSPTPTPFPVTSSLTPDARECFDPEPFEVERGTAAPSVAVRLDVENVAYDRLRSAYLDGEVMSQDETTVAGYDALRIEDRDTGGPLAPKGQRLTHLADLSAEKTLVLTTNEADAEDVEQAKELLDQMAERLERTD
jgi:hypothetical protein